MRILNELEIFINYKNLFHHIHIYLNNHFFLKLTRSCYHPHYFKYLCRDIIYYLWLHSVDQSFSLIFSILELILTHLKSFVYFIINKINIYFFK
jgi:hypothetical protein